MGSLFPLQFDLAHYTSRFLISEHAMPLTADGPFSPTPFSRNSIDHASDESISARTRHLLRVCQRAIQETKRLVPYGAGNQRLDIDRTKGESTVRSWAGRLLCPRDEDRAPSPIWSQSPVTLLVGAGNCQKQAMVVHDLLREKLSSKHCVALATAVGKDHMFAVAWHRYDPELKVAADSWPVNAQAILLKDHYCGASIKISQIRSCGIGFNLQERRRSKLWILNNRSFYDCFDTVKSGSGSVDPSALKPMTSDFVKRYLDIARYVVPTDRSEIPSVQDVRWPATAGRRLHYDHPGRKRHHSC